MSLFWWMFLPAPAPPSLQLTLSLRACYVLLCLVPESPECPAHEDVCTEIFRVLLNIFVLRDPPVWRLRDLPYPIWVFRWITGPSRSSIGEEPSPSFLVPTGPSSLRSTADLRTVERRVPKDKKVNSRDTSSLEGYSSQPWSNEDPMFEK